jgi:hypothetical protein
MIIRLMLTGACALFLVGCTAKDTPSSAGTPPVANVATDSKATFELGKTV